MTLRTLALALAAPALLSLAACGSGEEQVATDGPSTTSNDTLSGLLSGASDLGTAKRMLDETGLMQVFDEAPYYTLIAPTDAAFQAFDATVGEDEAGDEGDDVAAEAAVMRGHILPGYLTGEDIGAAIDAQGGPVTIQTMGDAALTFSREGEAIRVTSEDGSTGLLVGNGAGGSNGVLLPVDTVLKQL